MKSFGTFTEALQKEPGTQYGSNEGGIYHDTDTGDKHYVKFYQNPDQARVEALTGKIYDHMGIKTIKPEHKMVDGKHAIITKWNDKLGRVHPSEFEKLNPKQADQLAKMFHAAVLTKNWDIVGLEHDNIVKDKETGDLHAIDHGGAFHFRARGGPKEYGPDISEHESLRNNGQASEHVFNSLKDQYPQAYKNGIKAVKKINNQHVHDLFQNSGLTNWKDLYNNFSERKRKLLNAYR